MQGSNLRLVAAATALSEKKSKVEETCAMQGSNLTCRRATHPMEKKSKVEETCAMQGSNLRLLACEASALPLS